MLEDEGWEGSKQDFQPIVSNSRVRVTAPLAWEGLPGISVVDLSQCFYKGNPMPFAWISMMFPMVDIVMWCGIDQNFDLALTDSAVFQPEACFGNNYLDIKASVNDSINQ